MIFHKCTLTFLIRTIPRIPIQQRIWFNKSTKRITQTRKSLLPPSPHISSNYSPSLRDLIKPLTFTIAVCGGCFVTASIAQYEILRSKAKFKFNKEHRTSFIGKSGSLRQKVNIYWNSLLPGEKVVYGIMAVNAIVFCFWRIPRLYPFMLKYFVSSPASQAPCLSMLFSAFSHHSGFHIFANMYVLLSFSAAITTPLGSEQFLAAYISAAVISGFVSLVIKVLRKNPTPSIGASGAIMAVLGMVCTMQPNSRLSIAFVDQLFPHSFSADSAIKGILLFDFVGLIMGWRLLDHAAHLGGVLFGIWYVKYGNRHIWQKRENFIKSWHQIRGPP